MKFEEALELARWGHIVRCNSLSVDWNVKYYVPQGWLAKYQRFIVFNPITGDHFDLNINKPEYQLDNWYEVKAWGDFQNATA